MVSPSIRIIVVSYNARETLRACLLSIPETLPCTVVDNASSDGSGAMVAADFPHIYLIESPENIGFGAANNLAARAADEDFLFFVNPDILLPQDVVPGLQRACLLPNIGACGFALNNADGSPQLSFGPGPHLVADFGRGIVQRALDARKAWAMFLLRHFLNRKPVHRVPWVCGAALLVPRRLYEHVNGFDENYFLYFEDIDICFRLAEFGEIYLDCRTHLLHHGGVSAAASNGLAAVAYRQSQHHFWERWGSLAAARCVAYYLSFRARRWGSE